MKILTIDSQQYTETDYYYTNFNDCILLKEEIGLYTYYLIPTGISQPQLYLQINELINDGTDFVFNKFETTEKIEIIFDEEAILNENHFYYTQTGYLINLVIYSLFQMACIQLIVKNILFWPFLKYLIIKTLFQDIIK